MITSFTSVVGTVYEQEDVGETRDGAARSGMAGEFKFKITRPRSR